ncbi:MAG: putative filamentous hemagglutinin family outer membrane protein [Burkholderia sp.]|nr:putative filamentous hemagglutinin family outer membrane protein [Burkholderia sp.]
MGQLNGTLEGLGHDIKNLTINRPETSIVGLFSSIGAGGLVHNIRITNVSIAGNETVGALAGNNLGTISNVHVGGAIGGQLRTGGLVGINVGTISTARSEANVTGRFIAGGVVGGNEATGVISGSSASGSVSAGDPIIPVVDNGPGYAGGLAGYSSGTIKGSYASGSTAATKVAGGLVGENAGTIDDSYAQGSVRGNSYVGGLVGLFSGTGTGTGISNAYATGAVQGIDNQTTHGLVGAAGDRQVSNSYWNTDAVEKGGTGQSALTPGKGEGKTGAQLRQAVTFGNWDIASTGGTEKAWRIYEGISMPLLRSFLAPMDLAAAKTVEYSGAIQKNADIVASGVRTGAAASGRNVGTYQPFSNQQGYDISNGELVITAKPLTIEAQIGTRVYNGTTSASATLSDDRITNDSLTIAYTSAGFDTKDIGEQKTVTVKGITLGGDDARNYTFRSDVTTTGKITPFNLFYHIEGVDKVYDGTTNATVLMSAVKIGNEDVFTNRIASFDNKNAGVGKTVTTTVTGLRGTDSGNYTFTQPTTTTANITPRPLDITATAADKVYDGNTSALALLQDNRVAGDLLVTNAVASFNDKNAGAGKNVSVSGVAVTGADAGNYRYQPQTQSTTASITPRPLDITATATDKSYDGNTQTTAALFNNRLAGDAVTASYQRADFADKNGGQNKTVTVSGIAVAGADAANYKANTEASTTARIKPLSLTITANSDARLADGVPYQGGNGVSYSGLLPGETSAVLDGKLSYGGSAQNAMKEGVYRITPGGLTSVNYASTFVDGTLTIEALPPNAGQITAYTEPGRMALATYAGRSNGATSLSVADCGMRLPENLMLGGCQSASQPGSIGR